MALAVMEKLLLGNEAVRWVQQGALHCQGKERRAVLTLFASFKSWIARRQLMLTQ